MTKKRNSDVNLDGVHQDYVQESQKRLVSILECAVLYIRVSTDRHEQDDSYEAQFEILEKKAKEKGFVIYKVYHERHTATKISGRTEFDKMISDAEKEKFSAIFIKDLSRISRNTEVSGMLRRIATDNDINIFSISEGDKIEKNALMYGFASLANETYSQDLSRKVKASFLHKAQKGEYTRSEAPYGYHIIDKKLVVNDDESPGVVKLIHKLYQEGSGCLAIAKQLDSHGYIPPKRSKGIKNAKLTWGESGVRYILENPVYIGDLVQHKTETVSIYSRKRKKIDQPIVVENAHDAIITKEEFDYTKYQMAKRSSNQRVTPKSRLFSDVIYCGTCGNKHWFRSSGLRYICGNHARYGKKVCTSHVIKEDQLITILKKDFLSIINQSNHEDFLDQEIEKRLKQRIYKNKHEVEALKKSKEILDETNGKLLLAKFKGDIDEMEYSMALKALRKELEEKETRLKILESEKTEFDLVEIKRKVKFNALGFDEKTEINREFVNRFIDRIVIHEDDKIEIHYSFMNE